MCNQAEPNNNVPKFNVTTQSLGIADANAKDLAGFVLNQDDISTAVAKILLSAGVKNNAIRLIRVGCTQDEKLKIIVEINKKSLVNLYRESQPVQKNDGNSWAVFTDVDTENRNRKASIPKEFFNTLKNKVYYDHLDYKIVERGVKDKKGRNNGTAEYVRMEFDPDILIAFVYNLDYYDFYYHIVCHRIDWKPDKEVDSKMKNKEAEKYKKKRKLYLSDRLFMCTIDVVYEINKNHEVALYNKLVDNIASIATDSDDDKAALKSKIINEYSKNDFLRDFNNTLKSRDFHPKQVVDYMMEFGDKHKKKKKKH